MKSIIYLFFLLVAGAASVHGQSAPPVFPLAPPVFPPAPSPSHLLPIPSPGNGLLLPGHQADIPPGSPLSPLNVLLPSDPIRILRPDNMPCLVANLARVERMPVRRMTNAERMPNGYRKP